MNVGPLHGEAHPDAGHRAIQRLDTAATLKLKKQELKNEGFDPRKVEDPLCFRHPDTGNYLEMTEVLYDDVIQGKLRL